MEVVLKEDWFYTLYSEDAKLLLEVLCGSHGIYEIKKELSKEDIQEYNQKGKPFIDGLAAKIRREN